MLEDQVKALQQNTDTKTVETLIKQAEALIDKLGMKPSNSQPRLRGHRVQAAWLALSVGAFAALV